MAQDIRVTGLDHSVLNVADVERSLGFYLNELGVLTGPDDTDMVRDFDTAKASPSSVAQAIFNGVENEEEDIFPDPASAPLAESWRTGAVKGLEHWFATLARPMSA